MALLRRGLGTAALPLGGASEVDVAIMGAGPAGSALAALLSKPSTPGLLCCSCASCCTLLRAHRHAAAVSMQALPSTRWPARFPNPSRLQPAHPQPAGSAPGHVPPSRPIQRATAPARPTRGRPLTRQHRTAAAGWRLEGAGPRRRACVRRAGARGRGPPHAAMTRMGCWGICIRTVAVRLCACLLEGWVVEGWCVCVRLALCGWGGGGGGGGGGMVAQAAHTGRGSCAPQCLADLTSKRLLRV